MMNQNSCIIRFPGTIYSAVTLEKFANLSEHLTIQNSPVLFGCRTGVCGICVAVIQGKIPLANVAEQEILEVIAPGNSQIRLACQIDLTHDIEITPYIEK
ncbi:MAG: 2Fe-2S iron-sulfur cluster-binding protein [Microcoleaceae cyanobacterium]